jgi:hypothetical protein
VADLVVDLDLLARTAGGLSMLIEEFGNASKIVGASQGQITEPMLIGALDDFASDWSVHRQSLLSSMQSVYKMATESHRAYIDTDDKLAGELRNQGVK